MGQDPIERFKIRENKHYYTLKELQIKIFLSVGYIKKIQLSSYLSRVFFKWAVRGYEVKKVVIHSL